MLLIVPAYASAGNFQACPCSSSEMIVREIHILRIIERTSRAYQDEVVYSCLCISTDGQCNRRKSLWIPVPHQGSHGIIRELPKSDLTGGQLKFVLVLMGKQAGLYVPLLPVHQYKSFF